jgi:hypothetical protein
VAGEGQIPIGIVQNSKWPFGVENAAFNLSSSLNSTWLNPLERPRVV